ncbi:MAG TPA: MFS transporter, partial [Solirubrobacteraceae bacterium]|nr:MFS transporter [Solirubrobacteraceae bacterium]
FLWLAHSASVVGSKIVIVALALFVIGLTGSATDLGLVLAAYALSLVTFLLIGGVWADRLPRHRLMMATDLARFSLHALLAVLIFAGSVRIWELVAIEALYGGAEAFSRPAANGLLPQTVPEADIQQATAITGMSSNVSEFLGPALATALVLGAGAGWAFALDAVTFLASAALLSRVRPRARELPIAAAPTAASAATAPLAPLAPIAATVPTAAPVSAATVSAAAVSSVRPSAAGRNGLWKGIRAGSREVRSRTWVWATLMSFCVALFCGLAPWFVLGPLVARQQYGHVSVYGLIEAALGFGTILGSLAGILWRPRYPMRLAMLAILLWPAAAILYATGLTLALVLPATVLAGVGIALFDVWWLTALAERIPPASLSRVSSYDWMLSYGLMPFGYILAGPLAGALGPVEVMIGGSALACVAFALGLAPRETRMLERLHRDGRGIVRGEEPLRGLAHRS